MTCWLQRLTVELARNQRTKSTAELQELVMLRHAKVCFLMCGMQFSQHLTHIQVNHSQPVDQWQLPLNLSVVNVEWFTLLNAFAVTSQVMDH